MLRTFSTIDSTISFGTVTSDSVKVAKTISFNFSMPLRTKKDHKILKKVK
jgi:hypothetical protein